MSGPSVHALTEADRQSGIAEILADSYLTLDEFKSIAALDGGHGDEFDDERTRRQWQALDFLLGSDS